MLKGIESAIRDLIADEDKIAGEAARRREQDDLQTQQEMALWAFWMVIAAAVSIILTAIGIFLIWRTLHHTRRAADYTRDMIAEAKLATKAAEDAVSTTREIGEKQVKAYLTCTGGTFAIDRLLEQAWITIENRGQSPALNVTAKAAWCIMVPDINSISGYRRHDGGTTEATTEIIAAGASAKLLLLWEHSVTGTDAHDYLRSGNRYFDIDGILSWVDVFDKPNTITFTAHESSPDGPLQLGENFDRVGTLDLFNRSPRNFGAGPK